jgi:hypothetical protein
VKISGICGRLLCCLGYEHGMYEELAKDMPKLGKRIQTHRGEGKVVRRNVLEGSFVVSIENKDVEMTVEEYRRGAAAPQTQPVQPAPVAAPERLRAREAAVPRPPRPQGQPAIAEAGAEGAAEGQGPAQAQPGRRRRRRRRGGGSPGSERKSDG